MLQRLNSFFDELDERCGLWSRSELEDMNDRFVAAVEAAFQSGRESRKAAAATVRVGTALNGSRQRAVEAAIEGAWKFLCDERGDLPFAEVLVFVRKRVPGVDEVRVREGFLQRLRERTGELWSDPD